jgi:hypothetical protein
MKLGLIAKDSDQNRAIGEPLDAKPQRFQRCKKRISQLTAYADLVGKAHCSAPVHDRGFWLIPIEVLSDMRPPRTLTHTRWSITAQCSWWAMSDITPQG